MLSWEDNDLAEICTVVADRGLGIFKKCWLPADFRYVSADMFGMLQTYRLAGPLSIYAPPESLISGNQTILSEVCKIIMDLIPGTIQILGGEYLKHLWEGFGNMLMHEY